MNRSSCPALGRPPPATPDPAPGKPEPGRAPAPPGLNEGLPPIDPGREPPGAPGRLPPIAPVEGRGPPAPTPGLGRLTFGLGRLMFGLGRLMLGLGRLIDGDRPAEGDGRDMPPPPRAPPPPPPRGPRADAASAANKNVPRMAATRKNRFMRITWLKDARCKNDEAALQTPRDVARRASRRCWAGSLRRSPDRSSAIRSYRRRSFE